MLSGKTKRWVAVIHCQQQEKESQRSLGAKELNKALFLPLAQQLSITVQERGQERTPLLSSMTSALIALSAIPKEEGKA